MMYLFNEILGIHNILFYYFQAGIFDIIKDYFVWHASKRTSKLAFCASTLSSPALTCM